jgi:hypothetical protein
VWLPKFLEKKVWLRVLALHYFLHDVVDARAGQVLGRCSSALGFYRAVAEYVRAEGEVVVASGTHVRLLIE